MCNKFVLACQRDLSFLHIGYLKKTILKHQKRTDCCGRKRPRNDEDLSDHFEAPQTVLILLGGISDAYPFIGHNFTLESIIYNI